MSAYLGRIEPEYSVTCGRCGEYLLEGSGTKARAASGLRKLGWSLTRQHGWICPDCTRRKEREPQGRPSADAAVPRRAAREAGSVLMKDIKDIARALVEDECIYAQKAHLLAPTNHTHSVMHDT